MELTLGNAVTNAEIDVLRQQLLEAAQNNSTVTLDFQNTVQLDAQGIALLIEAHLELAKRGGALCFQNLSSELQQLFAFLGLPGDGAVQLN